MNRQTIEMLNRVQRYGIDLDDALALRRISMTLHRWYELECGDSNHYCSWAIERDEETDKPYLVRGYYGAGMGHMPKRTRTPIADREKGALKRLDKIMARYPELAAYLQTDPRGASLYIYRRDNEQLKTAKYGIESVYSSIGCAIYK